MREQNRDKKTRKKVRKNRFHENFKDYMKLKNSAKISILQNKSKYIRKKEKKEN